MSVTDPIADMLTVIRNAQSARKEKVDIPASKIKEQIVRIIKTQGYITDYRRIEDGKQGLLRVYLRYTKAREGVISGLRRISTSGRRVYVDKAHLPYVLGGSGVAVISTSRGIMTDKDARRQNAGGEVLCYIW